MESEKKMGNGSIEMVEYRGEEYRVIATYQSKRAHILILIIRNKERTLQVGITDVKKLISIPHDKRILCRIC